MNSVTSSYNSHLSNKPKFFAQVFANSELKQNFPIQQLSRDTFPKAQTDRFGKTRGIFRPRVHARSSYVSARCTPKALFRAKEKHFSAALSFPINKIATVRSELSTIPYSPRESGWRLWGKSGGKCGKFGKIG